MAIPLHCGVSLELLRGFVPRPFAFLPLSRSKYATASNVLVKNGMRQVAILNSISRLHRLYRCWRFAIHCRPDNAPGDLVGELAVQKMASYE